MQHALVALQLEKPSSYSIYNFVISLFGCPLALDARGRRPVCPPLCTPLTTRQSKQKIAPVLIICH